MLIYITYIDMGQAPINVIIGMVVIIGLFISLLTGGIQGFVTYFVNNFILPSWTVFLILPGGIAAIGIILYIALIHK